MVRTGFSKTGPGTKSSFSPIGSTGVRMSEKRIAASTPRTSTGWMVTSAASSGVLHSSRKVTFSRTAMYSGR